MPSGSCESVFAFRAGAGTPGAQAAFFANEGRNASERWTNLETDDVQAGPVCAPRERAGAARNPFGAVIGRCY